MFLLQSEQIPSVRSSRPADYSFVTANQITPAELEWESYFASRSAIDRNKIMERNVGIAWAVAHHHSNPPRNSAEEMFSFAAEGLIRAVETFDPARGVKFANYAFIKCRSMVMDALRIAGGKRNKEKKPTVLSYDNNEYLHNSRVRPNDSQGCVHGVSRDIESQWLGTTDQSFAAVDDADEWPRLVKGMDKREKKIVSAIVNDGLTQKEAGAVVGLCESRVSQIVGEIRERMTAEAA